MRTSSPLLAALLAVPALAAAPSARAIQPLTTFLAAAKASNPTNRQRAAEVSAREADVDRAFDRLLPSLGARGVYTYNQRPVEPELAPGHKLVIQPEHQLDAVIELDVPLLDLAARRDLDAAHAGHDASRAAAALTELQVATKVAAAYYQVVAAAAVVQAAERSLGAARELLAVAEERHANGAVPVLDVKRAQAAVAAAVQQRADASLALDLARHQLASLTGVEPDAVDTFATDDLHEEGTADAWLARGDAHPAMALADSRVAASDATASAAEARLVPTVAAVATEHLTNASGFADKNDYFQLSLVLSWRFDLGVLDGADSARAGATAARAARDQTERDVDDAIWEAWRRTHADIEASRAAREQMDAARTAADIAELSYQKGAGTQLDVVTAQRDAFLAEVNQVRADTRIGLDRVLLRLIAGRDPSWSPDTAP